MLLCRSCGSSRIRNGYQPPPFPLRMLLVRTVLCDNCNLQFYAFSPRMPSSGRERKKRSSRPDSDFAPVATAVDLSRMKSLSGEAVTSASGRQGLSASAETSVMWQTLANEEDVFENEQALSQESDQEDAAGDVVEVRHSNRPRCPRCQSIHTRRQHRKALERLLLTFTGSRPFQCESCGKRFYAHKPQHESHPVV